MQQNDGTSADVSEQWTSMNPSSTLNTPPSFQFYSKNNHPDSQLINTSTCKITIIFLLFVLFFFIAFAFRNISLILHQAPINQDFKNSHNFKKQQNYLIKNEPSTFQNIELEENYKELVKAQKNYLQVKDKINKLNKNDKIKQFDEFIATKYEYQNRKMNSHLDGQALQILQNGKSDSKFSFPSLIWLYLSQPIEKQSYLNQLTIENNKKLAKANNYILNYINSSNYNNYLSNKSIQEVKQILGQIQNVNLSFQIKQQLIQYAILVAVLEQNGGVFLEEYVSLLENFDWLTNINNNIFVNRGSRNVDAQVVAFYSVQHSSALRKQKKSEILDVKKFMRLYPAVEHFFIATSAKTAYIVDLKKQLFENLKKSDFQLNAMAKNLHQRHQAYKFDSNSVNIWKDILLISSQRILTRLQSELLFRNGTLQYAIDYYGLKTMNKYYFPYKMEFVLTTYQYQKTYVHLAKLTLQELETTVGPLKYLAIITPRNQIDYLLNKAKQGNKQHNIIKGSFLQNVLFPSAQQSFVISNPEKPYVLNNAPKWTKLPRVIWLFWDKGLNSSHATNQLSKRNLQKYASASGFKVVEVNRTNLREYIDAIEIERIQEAIYFNNRGSNFDRTLSDLVSLALLIKHGGVYMDASFILLQDLEWLINIAAYPSQFIFNRYGDLPSVFMFYNPHYGSQFDEWEVDLKYNTKAHWHLSYENNFIACEPQNELIINWYDSLLNYLTQPYSQTEEEFKKCGISQHKWSNAENTYLLPMDTIKCVIGNREQELSGQKDAFSPASKYYKIWSISGYNGVQKFRDFTNFQKPGSDDNLFFRRYSEYYVSQIIGKPRELIILYSHSNKELNQFIRDQFDNKMFHQCHHKSFFNQYLFSFRNYEEEFIVNSGNLLIAEKQKLIE